ncbi:thiol peroxidase [Malacoplasma penetrans]|uniref:Thiol peroxidase n=1 Tax=Malacoplasma penetrans (strain HF-2) TaxID=272633 RepID=Q8EW09_MALP2|nr:thiol peroxidase [Malacoplasma penetrans]RXY97195.1 thiol peroxidase [Malacoplasma penetrans]BAC44187.1 thiol peroxidase [Malacoplasma penetrans HF-2]
MKVDLRQPLVLENKPLTVGQKAPDFCLAKLDNFAICDVSLEDFGKKIKIISCFPSIDTGVCDMQTKKLFSEYGNNEKIVLLNVSSDSLFAFNKWCLANEAQNTVMLSDYRDHTFAKAYGVNIKDANLIYRSIFIIDEFNFVKYIQLSKGLTDELDFVQIKQAVEKVLGN